METNRKSITLIDGNSLMFRSYYATSYTGNLMKNREGIYTNALFGFCNMVNRLLTEEVDYAFVAFDAGKKTFRHQQYADYKGTRKPLPEELRMQIPLIKEYLDILKVKRAESLEFEGDDLIASVARLSMEDFDEIRVITGDRDLLQLVNGKITVCLTKKGIGELDEYNEGNFREKTGMTPGQVVEYKAIVGDASDNLPGVKGVGDVTAIKLLGEYGNLDAIYQNLNKLTPRVRAAFEESREMAYRCRYLATLKSDIKLDFEALDLRIKKYDVDALIEFFQKMEFNAFLKKLNQQKIVPLSSTVTIVNDPSTNLSDWLKEDAYVNMESFGASYYQGKFLGISFVASQKQLFLTAEAVLGNPAVRTYLEDPKYKKKTFDFKAMKVVLTRVGINLQGVTDDFMLAAYLINPAFGSDDIKKTMDNFCANSLAFYENIYGANTKMKIPPIEIYAKYSVDKGLLLRNLDHEIHEKLEQIEVLDLYRTELQLSEVLAEMERNGLLIDLKELEINGKEMTAKAESIQEDIYFIAGEEFNINSPKQLGEILFEKLHLPHGKKNKTGYSTNVDILDKLAKDYVIAREILEYRTYTKLISTYINGIRDLADQDHFIHPLYKQALTLTGRLSSVEPNIQNMPIRSEEGEVIREFFISRWPNGVIMSADYSQIELRVLAHMANDPVMIEAFAKSIDFHTQTAARLNDIPAEQVTKEMRRVAKAINFGIIYGMSAWGLSEAINISQYDANVYINKYFYTYQRTKAFLDETVANARKDGYTKTLFNRRRYIPEATSDNATLRNFGDRTAMNAPIQGSAADIIKIAMNRISQRMKKEHLRSLMIAQVHDELVFDCLPEEVETMKKMVEHEMEHATELRVHLNADVAVGKNWAQAK